MYKRLLPVIIVIEELVSLQFKLKHRETFMISCYIISEAKTVELLTHYIQKFPLTTLLGHTTLLAKDLSTIIKLKPKIVFVDASLLQSCKTTLLRIAHLCTVIYVSDDKRTAIDALDALAFDFVLKDHSFERFEMSMNKFVQFSLRTPESEPKNIAIPIQDFFFIKIDAKGSKQVKIRCDDVVYIEAEQNYVKLHLVCGKCYTSHNTMIEMEESLPQHQFGRVHKSFIINFQHINSIEGDDIYLSEHERPKIHIGNTYKKAFLEKKNQNLIRRKTYLQVLDYGSTASIFSVMTGWLFDLNDLFMKGLSLI